MPIMNEAVPQEEFERMERGERPRKEKPVPRPEPEAPKVQDLIKYDDISLGEFEKIVSANVRRVRNKDQINFIGYDMVIKLKNKVIKGWMIEGDYEKLKRTR